MKKSLLFSSCLGLCFLMSLTSCSVGGGDVNRFIRENAVSSLNTDEISYNSYKLEGSMSSLNNSHYIKNGSSYTNLITGKTIMANRLTPLRVDSLGLIYQDDENNYYDVYGNQYQNSNDINFLDMTNLKIDSYVVIVSKDSDTYKHYCSHTYLEPELHMMNVVSITYRTLYGVSIENFIKEEKDTYYRFDSRYYFDGKNNFYSAIESKAEIVSDTLAYVYHDNYCDILEYDNSNYSSSNVRHTSSFQLGNRNYEDEYKAEMVITFKDSKRFVYSEKEIKGISNEFSYVDSLERYILNKAEIKTITATYALVNKVDYVPFDYILSSDGLSALLLTKKILDDGTLSNTWYSKFITSTSLDGRLNKDISPFENVKSPYILNGKLKFLGESKKLLALANDYAIIEDKDHVGVITSDDYETIYSFEHSGYYQGEKPTHDIYYVRNTIGGRNYFFVKTIYPASESRPNGLVTNELVIYDYLAKSSEIIQEIQDIIDVPHLLYVSNDKVVFKDDILTTTEVKSRDDIRTTPYYYTFDNEAHEILLVDVKGELFKIVEQ